ncbi:MAG: proline--tRNA ligase [Chloroflexi bacterium]|nr:proline--tRNA ligase [Chloroflexota bacterium]
MRMSRLFSQTLREAPADAEVVSHQLLLRAGFIRPLAAGIFSYLPLAQRALHKISAILREEMEAIGGQEVLMPVVHPGDLWQESGRWYAIGSEMGRFLDKNGREMALAMTHEEVVADLVRKEIRSYRQLPALLYHIQTKWRDDPRPRAGLIRGREFTMKDSYSLDADEAGLDAQYRAHYAAYFRIFARTGLSTVAVKSDTGMMGGSLAHEFMYLTDIGEDTLMLCDQCGYAANRQIARARKPENAPEAPLPLQKVATPNTTTIEALAQFLNIPKAKTAKAVFLVGKFLVEQKTGERFVLAIVRGDMDANETKIASAVHALELRPARAEEIRAVGAVAGYGSPIGTQAGDDLLVVIDEAVAQSANLVAGANDEGYHLLNTNYPRDYQAQVVADITTARAGDACPECGVALRAVRGVEVGNIFKLGTRYSETLGATYLDQDGKSKPVVMGSYGIGVTRVLACVAEQYHDDYGLCWPVTVAPYQVYLASLAGKDERVEAEATRLYETLRAAHIEVLYDDRDERPGVKFNDADLIGLPLRLTISARSLEKGGVELKVRTRKDIALLPLDEVVERLRAALQTLYDEIMAGVKTVTLAD